MSLLTELYEGFYHLNNIEGDVETTTMNYIIRNHDKSLFQKQKDRIFKIQDFLNDKYGSGTIKAEIRDTYYNMKDIIKDHMEVIDIAEEAIRLAGMVPSYSPIRGGTDGAQLTYHGLICPNLATGGWNPHGRYECITIEAMDKCTQTLINIVKIIAARQ
jgi:tripeptide aminopeptidase